MAFLSRTEFTEKTLTDQVFSIPFDYRERSDLAVFIRSTPTASTETLYPSTPEFIDDNQIRLPDMAIGTFAQVRRTTPKEVAAVYLSGNAILSSEANQVNKEVYFILEEICDELQSVDTGDVANLSVTYEVQLGGSFNGAGAGPVVFGRAARMGINGGLVRTAVGTNPSATQLLLLEKNGVQIGVISITDLGVVTVTVASAVDFVLGDTLTITNPDDEGLRDFGIVFIMEVL